MQGLAAQGPVWLGIASEGRQVRVGRAWSLRALLTARKGVCSLSGSNLVRFWVSESHSALEFPGFCSGTECYTPVTSPLSRITALQLAEAQWSLAFSVVFTLCSPEPRAGTFRERGGQLCGLIAAIPSQRSWLGW